MDCPLRSGHDLAEAYVTGTLPEAELDAYEQHFYDCSACLAQVKSLQALADRLRQLPAGPAPYPTTSPGRSAAPWLALACAAGLIAAFGWWWQGGAPRAPDARPLVAAAAPATPRVEAASRHDVLTQLARVVPPHYVLSAARAGEAPPAGSFDAAMAHYVAGRHREAAAVLHALSATTPADPGIAFFSGISELVAGRPAAARESLTRSIAADVPPYADEAHFYLAKAYLAEDAVDQARRELHYAVEHEAGPDGEAQRLLEALDRLPR